MEYIIGIVISFIIGFSIGKISEHKHAEEYLSKKYRMRNACIRIKERE